MTHLAKTNPVAARFSAAAQSYDSYAEVQRTAADKLVRFIQDHHNPKRILDLGCGTGILTALIAQAFPAAEIKGIDIAVSAVAIAEAKFTGNPRIRCIAQDMMELTPEAPFDLIVSSSSFHWISTLGELFRRISGLLSSGGTLFFAMMLRGTLKELHESRARVAPDKLVREQLPDEAAVFNALSAAGMQLRRHERETLTRTYTSASELLTSLRATGATAGPVSTADTPLSRQELAELVRDYDLRYDDRCNGVYASYEIMYAACGAPEE